MRTTVYSTILNLLTFNLDYTWHRQIIGKIDLNFSSQLDFKYYRNWEYKFICAKVNNLLRILFPSFCDEETYLFELIDGIGYDLNLETLFEEQKRLISLKKLNRKFSLLLIETDAIRKKVSIKLQFKQKKLCNSNGHILDYKYKKKNKKLNINILNIQHNSILLKFFHFTIFSRKYAPLTYGQCKKLKFFNKFIYLLVMFEFGILLKTQNLKLKKTECFVIKRNSFFFQLFFKKKEANYLSLVYLICLFYFIVNFIKKPLLHFKLDIYLSNFKKKKSEKNIKFLQNYFRNKKKFISNVIYFVFSKKIYIQNNFNRYFLAQLSFFISKFFFLAVKNNFKTKIKFSKVLSFKKLLMFNIKNRSQKAKKLITLLARNLTIFKIRLMINKSFKNANKIEKFINFICFICVSKLFLKSYFRILLIKFEFKTKIMTKYDKKKNKYELSLKSEKNLIGFYLPVHFLKNNKSAINFYVRLNSEWQTFEIFLGNRRNVMSIFRSFIIPYPFLELFDNDIICFHSDPDWVCFFDLKKDKMVDLFLPSVSFVKLLFNQNYVYPRRHMNPRYQMFYFFLNFLKKSLTHNYLIKKKRVLDEIIKLETVNYWKIMFGFTIIIFVFWIEN
nr:hypothetical protein Cry52Nrm3_p068 [Cryptomonas curvata]